MAKRSMTVAVCAGALGLVVAAGSAKALGNSMDTSYLTFSRPVALPGVGLAPGTYRFERVNPMGNAHVIRVSDRANRRTYFMGLTLAVSRPSGMPENHQIVFRESVARAPAPIEAWYPAGRSTGEQFIYPHGR